MVDAKTEGWIEIAQRGFENWKAKPHNARWFRKIDGTPIPNDLTICIGEAFAEPLRSLSLRVEAEKRAREEAERWKGILHKQVDDFAERYAQAGQDANKLRVDLRSAETRSAELARALDEAKTGLTLAANDFRDIARHLTEEPRDMALAAHETAQAFLAKIGTIKFSTARDDLLRELAQVQRPADADDRPCDDTWEDANLLWDFADRARATLEAPND